MGQYVQTRTESVFSKHTQTFKAVGIHRARDWPCIDTSSTDTSRHRDGPQRVGGGSAQQVPWSLTGRHHRTHRLLFLFFHLPEAQNTHLLGQSQYLLQSNHRTECNLSRQ